MVNKVPFIDLTRTEPGFFEQVTHRHREIVKNCQFVGGPLIEAAEKGIAADIQVPHVISCANGTDAIQLALRAKGIGSGDIVFVPDLTFWATLEAVVNVGAEPAVIDVDPNNLHMSLEIIQKASKIKKPKAIILVHLYGWVAPETLAIRQWCKSQNIVLLEDCAQAYGAKINNESVFTGADICTISFYPAKVLGACGEAGAVTCQDENTAKIVRSLSNHGRYSHYEYQYIGWNSRMGTLEAAFVLESLPHIKARIDSRQKIIEYYRRTLNQLPMKILSPEKSVTENGYLSLFRVKQSERPKFIEYLKQKDIGHGVVYPSPLSNQPMVKDRIHKLSDVNNTLSICSEIISLPCFAYMRPEEAEYVVQAVKEFWS
jgi:UDP-2-acetamido-2-deoxy-ribo-hexuluronate aminotransferase